MNNFIPINVIKNKKSTTWYLDISNLNLSELIALKKELNGKDSNAIRIIDKIFHSEVGYQYQEMKSIKRESKKIRSSIRNSKTLIKALRKQGR